MLTSLLNKLTRTDTESFVVESNGGNQWCVGANRCKLRDGNLIFLTGWHTVVAVAVGGAWLRTQRGVRLEDLKAGE